MAEADGSPTDETAPALAMPAGIAAPRRDRLVTMASCLAVLAFGANSTAIMAVLPAARQALDLGGSEIEWAVNAYLVASAAFIVPGGAAADRFEARGVAILGLLVFASGSIVIATAGAAPALLAGRVLQGVGAAFGVPATLAVVGAAASERDRGAAIGAWAGFLMAGFSLGPLLGGALTHGFGWPAVFWVNAAAMVPAAAGLRRAATPVSERPRSGAPPFDLLGAALLAGATVGLVFALHALNRTWRDPVACLAPLGLAGGAAWWLVNHERRTPHPLLDRTIAGNAEFLRAAALSAIAMFGIFALLLYFNLDAQSPGGLGLSPIEAGLVLLPMGAGLLGVALTAPRLVGRLGPRRAIAAALVLVAAASLAVAASVAAGALALLCASLLALGAGLALPYATGPRLALAALPPGRSGQGSGVINACTFLGGSLGVTLGGMAYAWGGLASVMALLAVLALAGLALARFLPAGA